SRVAYWWTGYISGYQAPAIYVYEDTEISNVTLVSPISAHINLPYAFTWSRRETAPTDKYAVAMYDPSTFNPYWEQAIAANVTSMQLTARPPGFSSKTPYVWTIKIYSTDGGFGGAYYQESFAFQQ